MQDACPGQARLNGFSSLGCLRMHFSSSDWLARRDSRPLVPLFCHISWHLVHSVLVCAAVWFINRRNMLLTVLEIGKSKNWAAATLRTSFPLVFQDSTSLLHPLVHNTVFHTMAEPRLWHCSISHHLGCQDPIVEHWLKSQLFHFQSNSLLTLLRKR